MSIWGSNANPSDARLAIRNLILKSNLLHKGYSNAKYFFQGRLKKDNYNNWIKNVEQPMFEKVYENTLPEHFVYQPKISILLPVFNVHPKYLSRAIKSVQAQKAQNWQLCIHDDGSTLYKDENNSLIKEFMKKEARIFYSESAKNENLSESTNKAFLLSTGDFVTFLDQDDQLSPYAIYFVTKTLNEDRKIKIIYSDEDNIADIKDEQSQTIRQSHFFKPDFAPDTLLSMPYTTHLTAYDSKLFKKMGGYRIGYEGAQDFDMILRASELVSYEQIYHIPHVLYHWRTVATSTASVKQTYKDKKYAENKSRIEKSQEKALKDAIMRRKEGKDVKAGMVKNSWQVIYPVEPKKDKVYILIPTKNREDMLKTCLDSIKERSTYKNYEVVIIDNQSCKKESLDFLANIKKEYGRKFSVIKYDKPFNYSAINNYAFNKSVKNLKNAHLLFLNNDTQVISPDWIEQMLMHSKRDSIGVVGALLLFANETVQHAGIAIGTGIVGTYLKDDVIKYSRDESAIIRVASEYHKYYNAKNSGYMERLKIVNNVSAVTGACMMIKASLFKQLGGFDEQNLPITCNDMDLCLKALDKGLRNIYTPYAKLYHYESYTRKEETYIEKISDVKLEEINFFRKKWSKYIDHDPYYNKNFSKDNANFEI